MAISGRTGLVALVLVLFVAVTPAPLATLLIATSSTALLGQDFGEQAQAYGAFTWANIVLLAALCVILRRGEGAAT